jgi:hypothetical protein
MIIIDIKKTPSTDFEINIQISEPKTCGRFICTWDDGKRQQTDTDEEMTPQEAVSALINSLHKILVERI